MNTIVAIRGTRVASLCGQLVGTEAAAPACISDWGIPHTHTPVDEFISRYGHRHHLRLLLHEGHADLGHGRLHVGVSRLGRNLMVYSGAQAAPFRCCFVVICCGCSFSLRAALWIYNYRQAMPWHTQRAYHKNRQIKKKNERGWAGIRSVWYASAVPKSAAIECGHTKHRRVITTSIIE